MMVNSTLRLSIVIDVEINDKGDIIEHDVNLLKVEVSK